MSIEEFYTTTFTIKRQTWSGDSSSNVSQGTFLGHIQQGIEKNLNESLGLRFTKPFTIYCALNTNIAEGDRIENGSDKYDVKYITEYDISGETDNHLEVIVEKVDD